MNIVTSAVTSLTVLYLANSGVNTPISSPPFDIVMAETVRKGTRSRPNEVWIVEPPPCGGNRMILG
jgi:hypothetical protein